ncbi:sugar kinase [Vibrio aquaticus]|uniref:2-dehydro-3-deoxygluconokinase n=1 Tax=Vibrio aquaticus TaxID=2496559 RepID=A0A3S0P8Q1_9VIBR|nr:sugar kinase [Vibrio aquaticus]RTZ17835.1 sugar kinase [Vibrio aquaticus]
MTHPLHIAFFGECMIELSGLPLKKGFGGDTLNTALYLSRLTQNTPVSVSYATGLGEDALSQQLIEAWQQEGINTTLVEQFSDKLPGLYMVETDSQGERSFMYWRDSAAVKSYFLSAELSKLEQAMKQGSVDAVYLSGISLAILSDECKSRLIQALSDFSHAGGQVIFDNNFRPQLWTAEQAQHWYSKLLPLVDIALITEDDDQLVWGVDESVEQRSARLGCKETVIKRGCEPCKVIWQQDGNTHHAYVSAERVTNVVDTCAAGDSFAAGYLAARLNGQSAQYSAALGHQLASTVIQFSGAIIPTAEMVHLTLS